MTTWAVPFTVLMVGLWVLAFARTWRQRPFYAMVLVIGSAFAFVSEYSAIRLGKYFYGSFPLEVCFGTPTSQQPWILGLLHQPQIEGCVAPNWCIPIGVLALEGLVFFSILRTTDLLAVNRWSKPFLDGLIAINLDAILDPVASASRWCGPGLDRSVDGLGLWTWFTGPQDVGYWFGVPLANYTAWFGSVVAFTIAVRTVARFLGAARRHVLLEALAAIVALVGLILLSALIVVPSDLLLNRRFDSGWQFGVVVGIVVVSLAFIVPTMRSWKRNQPFEWLPVVVQGALYAFCLAAILFTDRLEAKSGLLALWVVATAIGMGLVLAPFRKAHAPSPSVAGVA